MSNILVKSILLKPDESKLNFSDQASKLKSANPSNKVKPQEKWKGGGIE